MSNPVLRALKSALQAIDELKAVDHALQSTLARTEETSVGALSLLEERRRRAAVLEAEARAIVIATARTQKDRRRARASRSASLAG